MKRLALTALLCLGGLSQAQAAAYFQQASLPPVFPVTAGMDRDSLGNLYVLGKPAGSATYWVTALRTPEMTTLFSFDTSVSTPLAFAVEPSGIVEVADLGATAIILRRFQNSGAFIGQASIPLMAAASEILSGAFDKSRGLLNIATKQWKSYICVQCLGCPCPPPGYRGFLYQYDYSGTLIRTFQMPGVSATAGTCYTPSSIAADGQGNLFIADNTCQHLLKYSPTGTLMGDWTATSWTSGYPLAARGMWTDAESDLYIGQTICGPTGCQPGVVKLDGTGNLIDRTAADSSAACAWDDRMLYLAGPAAGAVRRFIYNTPPAVPTEISPIGPTVQHSSSAAFAWQFAADSEGDQIIYGVSLGTSPTNLNPIGSLTSQNLESSPLAFETTYYWQVTAQDQYQGVPVQTQQAPVVSFRLSLQNSPPSAFAVTAGTGTVITRDTAVQLSWQRPADADGDNLVYDLSWRSPGQAPVILSTLTATSQVMSGLSFGATYYWSVRARDIYGASSSMAGGQEQPYYPRFRNEAPATPAYLNAASVYSLHTASPAVPLAWSPSQDLDGDPVSYRAEIASDAATVGVNLATATAFTLPLAFETTYYWRAIASDPYGGTSTGPWQNLIAHLANQAPTAPVYLAPTSLVTRSTSAVLAWQDTGDPDGDPYSYSLFLSTDPGNLVPVQSGLRTSFTLGFQYGATYYWQVSATDSFGARTDGPVQTFVALFRNSAPGMPTIFSGSGTSFQHTLTPAASLSWSAVNDPDGDATAYRLSIGMSPQSLAVVQDGPQSTYNLPSPQLGTTYYWQVSAYDPYGGVASTPVQLLSIQLQNSAPSAPGALTGSGLLSTRNTSQILSWSTAFDPDGDPVAYEFSLSTDAAVLPVVRVSTGTSYPLSFQYGTTYYWQATARDSFGGVSATGVQSFLPVFRNSAPTVPSNLSKTGTLSYHGLTPSQSLFWQDAADPDGDAFTYSVYFGTDSERPSLIGSAPLGYTVSNLAVNTAYYYRIVATDIHGAASASPLNWVYYQFYNTAPRAFDPAGPSGPLVTRNANQSLSWTASSDADGDLVTYRVHVGTAAGSLAPLTDTTQTAAQWPGLAFGATYYWRVDAYDAFGATTAASGGVQSFGLTFRNSAPATPVYVSTAAVREFHTLSPELSLSWSPTSDPDGDAVAYRLDLGPSTGSWQSFGLADATAFTLKPLFDATYYWRVTAVDPYGGSTTGPWSSLVARFVNRVPAVPSILSGAGASRQHTLTPSIGLSWSASADPDGDPVAYRLHVGTSPSGLAPVQEGSQTAYLLPAPQFGTTYYWQVSAVDSYSAVSTTPVQSLFLSLDNSPPTAFPILTGSGALSTRATSQLLSWEASHDADGDPLAYSILLSSDPASLPVVQTSTTTSFLLSFQYGTTYYWRVDAYDGFGGTTTATGGQQTFLPSFLNDPPDPLNVTSPFKGSPIVSTMHNQVSISWERVTTPQGDPITYTVYLGDSPESLQVLTRISQEQAPAGLALSALASVARPQSQVEADGTTVKLKILSLDFYRRYYLRITASNPYGSTSYTPLQAFSLSALSGFPKAYNYPNPFSPGRGGTRIVFNAPPSGYARATVSIYSELQDLLFRREYSGIPAGVSEVVFDGRDRYGRPFFNGSYICHVRFEGPDDKETFYLMVVK